MLLTRMTSTLLRSSQRLLIELLVFNLSLIKFGIGVFVMDQPMRSAQLADTKRTLL